MAEARHKWIQPGISMGNVIVLVTMVAGLAAGWGRLEAGLSNHDRRITENASDVKEIQRDLRPLSTELTEIRSDMKYLIQEVGRTRQTLERLDRERRGNP